MNETVFSEFVVLYSYSTLLNIILTTIFSAPILVFGIKKWDKTKFNYLSVNIIGFTIFNIVFSVISFFFLRIQVAHVFLLNFLLMNFGLTLVDIFKRFIFSNKVISTGFAPISSLLMNITFFSGIYAYRDSLNLNRILVIYWVAYLLASLFFIIIIYFKTNIKKELSVLGVFNKEFYKSVFFTHFNYAKWILAGAVSFWVYTQGIYIFGKAFGVSDFAISKLRIIQNLFGVFTILLIAMDNFLTPTFSMKALESVNLIPVVMKDFYKRYTKPLVMIYVVSIPVMYIVYYFLYQDKYGEGITYILIVWFAQLIAMSTKPISIALKAKEVTYPLFFSHLFGAISMLIFGVVLITLFNDIGLVLTLLFAFITANLMNYIYYRKIF
ncbi:polysaccharide biosynthesis protein [Winogradskyella helgolandensis]|uniref:hypothetical protein n=1 Tax=Winogradskyella helgolandensis TaxID=2697010 RepID=UPI0015CBD081|nr:hypothetical protein [Winogradskyella helgolandensis]